MPNFAREAAIGGLVCGIDEVGRGPLAGPVVAAAVILDRQRMPKSLRQSIDDSKKLTPDEREEYAAALRSCATIALGAVCVGEIDRINILRASLLAMRRAVAALPVRPTAALVDGNQAPNLPCPVHTVIGGDGLSLSIAAASIVAKVARDRLMQRLALRYEGYGWTTNVGYATPEHRAAIVRLGLTPHHRLSFQPCPDLFGFEFRESP
jgi:ribonuclease HII